MKELRIKRIYEAIEEQDGYRVLTDRLWPRGIYRPLGENCGSFNRT